MVRVFIHVQGITHNSAHMLKGQVRVFRYHAIKGSTHTGKLQDQGICSSAQTEVKY